MTKLQFNPWLSLSILIALILNGCVPAAPSQAPIPPQVEWPTYGWKTSTPEQQGMDSDELVKMFEYILEKQLNLHSVLIVRNGYLVTEAYFQPFQEDNKHLIASCTKSFTSALVGIAIDKGFLEGVDQKVLGLFPERTSANNSSSKKAITLELLLTMSSGLEWSEWRPYDMLNSEIQMENSPDWVQFVLDRPLSAEPVTRWNYNSGNSHLLSAVVQKTTGMSALAFAQTYLFKPLGISDVVWGTDPEGINFGGAGLELTPRDMARFGYLYLQNGVWDGQQVVSTEWVKASTAIHIQTDVGHDYGYQWWLHSFGSLGAEGYGGQRIFVAPDHQIVAIITAGLAYPGMETIPDELFENYILEAGKSSDPLPENPQGMAQLASQLLAIAHPQAGMLSPLPEVAEQISGRKYVLESNSLGIKAFTLYFTDGEARIKLWMGGASQELTIGLDDLYRTNPVALPLHGFIAFRGFWQSDGFNLSGIYNGAMYNLRFSFSTQGVVMKQYGLAGEYEVTHGTPQD